MKIIQIFLAMLIFASPAFGVTVRCFDEGNGVVRIDYDATDEDALPLAFALDITVDNGATINSISEYKVGDSTANEPGYGIFPRSLVFDDGGMVADWGFPDVKPDADTVGVKPGLGTSGITIEMGSRYSGAENAPLTNDMLFKINIDNHGAQEVNVTIVPNIAGGGVVLESAVAADVTAVGCALIYSDTVPANELPVISLLTASPSSIYENQTSQFQVTANDPDVSPSGLVYNWVVPPGSGSVDDVASSNPTYLPPDITTTQTFAMTVEVSDGLDTVSSAVYITVQPEIIEPPVVDPDTITIKKVEYKVRTKELKVEAVSSAQPDVTLMVEGYGPMVWNVRKKKYVLKVKPVADPGGSIIVTSSSGGSTTRNVTLR